MQTSYTTMITELNAKIRRIKDDALSQIAEKQYDALEKTKSDFALIGWGKYWRHKDLHSDGQFEQLVESVTDQELKFIWYDKKHDACIVDGKAKYSVSGSGCSCSAFITRGLPCKHMYFLAAILAEIAKDDMLTLEQFIDK